MVEPDEQEPQIEGSTLNIFERVYERDEIVRLLLLHLPMCSTVFEVLKAQRRI